MRDWTTTLLSVSIVLIVIAGLCFLAGIWTGDDRFLASGPVFLIPGIIGTLVGGVFRA